MTKSLLFAFVLLFLHPYYFQIAELTGRNLEI
jgi:hypothetical protein